MSGLELQIAEQIDAVIRTSSAGVSGDDRPVLGELLATVGEFLAQPVPPEVRDAALALVELSKDGVPQGSHATFLETLTALRDAVSRLNPGVAGPPALSADDEAMLQLANDPELVQEFLLEAREHLTGVEAGVLALEQDPEDAEALNGVFRSFHTIKGVAAFMGASAIQELSHETENLLDYARSGRLLLSQPIIDLILRAADELTKCLNMAESQSLGSLPRCDRALLKSLADTSARVEAGAVEAQGPLDTKEVARGTTRPAASGGVTSKEVAVALPAAVDTPARTEIAESTAVVPQVVPTLSAPTLAAAAPARSTAENSVVRIETSKLEYLIDMVGELVIAESVVRHDPAIAASQDPLLSRNLTQLARVVQEVQKTSMSMRMVAIGTLFRKMSRLTRDLAKKSGKTIELVTVGDDVELDRSIVEDLADPMVHMIRNAVDHGLELASERIAAGKPGKGTVRLRAMHDAGDIVIEIGDDGRGMDPARILAKARRLGLVGEHDSLDEESIFKLVFEAGFSTADKVTDLSGRGVGMDVVKKQIQKLRGRISIRSVLGQGCSFVLRLPLTLAIIDGLVVGVSNQRFILPMFAVREMFSPKPDTFVTIENKAEAAFFRNKLLPLIRLSRLLELRDGARVSSSPDPEGGGPDARIDGVLIVVEGRDQLYCIAVDQLIGKQEVVIKSLGKTFRDVPAISGGAILGDGRVGLIIDVNSLRYQR